MISPKVREKNIIIHTHRRNPSLLLSPTQRQISQKLRRASFFLFQIKLFPSVAGPDTPAEIGEYLLARSGNFGGFIFGRFNEHTDTLTNILMHTHTHATPEMQPREYTFPFR